MTKSPETDITIQDMRANLYSAVVCDVLDGVGLKDQAVRAPLRLYSGGATGLTIVGRARTTLWVDMYHADPRPYELELEAVDACRPDEILVAAAGGSRRSAVWGELLSTAARARGCIAAVVDGLTRDVRATREMDFPVFARGVSPYDSKDRQRVVDLDVPVQIGGVEFVPGDLVFADLDGIVVVPRRVEAEVMAEAWRKVHAESQVRRALRGGMSAKEAFEQFGVL